MQSPINPANRAPTTQKPVGGTLLAAEDLAAVGLIRDGVLAAGAVVGTGCPRAAVAGARPPFDVTGSTGEAGAEGAATPDTGPDEKLPAAGVSLPVGPAPKLDEGGA